MSPALVKKYLEAARAVADHLVLKPRRARLRPAPGASPTPTATSIASAAIIDFYKRQQTDYADYFLAAWRFRHREALGQPDASLADLAAEAGLSPKYLATVWSIARPSRPEEVGPIAALQALWRELPAPDDGRSRTPRGPAASGCATSSSSCGSSSCPRSRT